MVGLSDARIAEGASRPRWMKWVLTLSLITLHASRVAPCQAQLGRGSFPTNEYFAGFRAYDEGEYADALKVFQNAAKGGVRSTEGRWVDSICYHAMIGECYYRMGDNEHALDQFSSAVKLYIAHQDWLFRVRFDETNLGAIRTPNVNITWGLPTRKTSFARIPDTMQSLQGTLNPGQQIQRGGVIAPQEFWTLHVPEIMRCTGLAIRRRAELMGPTSRYDPITTQLQDVLARRPAPPNHWSQTWIDALQGFAYVADGKLAQAGTQLQRSLQLVGEFDHQLTPMALVEMGKLQFQEGNFQTAATLFLEASYSAAIFRQHDVIAEALEWGATTHMVSGQQGPYAPLAPVAAWASKSRALRATVLALGAEQAAIFGDKKQTAAVLTPLKSLMNRKGLLNTRTGIRYRYAVALASFQSGDLATGSTAIGEALQLQQKASLWLFQTALANALHEKNLIGERTAIELYDQLLREPIPRDWSVDPVDTLARILSPHLRAMENYFELTLSRKELEKAILIADRIRRLRFYGSLPLGGRLLALRWVLEAPNECVENAVLLQRQDLLGRYPAFAEASRLAAEARQKLRDVPLVSETKEQADAQAKLLKDLAKATTAQEQLIHLIALRREPSEFPFPPLVDPKAIQAKIPAGQYVLTYFFTRRALHAFLITKEKYSSWTIDSPGKVNKDIATLLKKMGNHDENSSLGKDDLRGEGWRGPARELLLTLTNRAPPDAWKGVEELVVVPDGTIWYVPFEALELAEGDSSTPLIAKLRVRYAPTFGLAFADRRATRAGANTVVVAGKLTPRDTLERSLETVKQLESSLPGTLKLPEKLTIPSGIYATLFDRLLVLQEIEHTEKAGHDWAPLGLDKGKPGCALGNWFTLPWGRPEQVVLPGFHTAAEGALKGGGTGDELFLATLGFMASGSRTVMLSRWRTGGASSQELMREFTQELPHAAASQAWQRSVQLFRASELDSNQEPRIGKEALGVEVSGKHPFFWAGFILSDTGAAPRVEE